MDDCRQLCDLLAKEAAAFRLLGSLLYREPPLESLNELIRDDIFADSPLGTVHEETERGFAVLKKWMSRNGQGVSLEEYQSIKNDHFRLFSGVGKPLAPIWESVYFNDRGMVFQKQTLDVRERYRNIGLQCEKRNREPDDQLGLELLFISQAASRTLTAIENGNDREAHELLSAKNTFLCEHTLCWESDWADLVELHARTDFYRGIALLVSGFLNVIAERFELKPMHHTFRSRYVS